MEIRDKVVLVTGSTLGIGRAIGEKLCRLGAIVYFNSHNSSDEGDKLKGEFQETGLKAFYVVGDVSSEKDKVMVEVSSASGKTNIICGQLQDSNKGIVKLALKEKVISIRLSPQSGSFFNRTKKIVSQENKSFDNYFDYAILLKKVSPCSFIS